MKKKISVLMACLFAIALSTYAQENRTDSTGCHAAGKQCCKKDATAKKCSTAEMKHCVHEATDACCGKSKEPKEKSCCKKNASKACCSADKKEKSTMKDCPMHKG